LDSVDAHSKADFTLSNLLVPIELSAAIEVKLDANVELFSNTTESY